MAARSSTPATLQIPAGLAGYLLRPQRPGGAAITEGFEFASPLQSGASRKTCGQRCLVLVSHLTQCVDLMGEFLLFSTGELSTCWYILLSGSVFIDGSMFLPRSR